LKSEPKICPICGAVTRLDLHRLYDDRYGYSGSFDLQACERCGHRHVPAEFKPRHLGRLYTQFYPRAQMTLDDLKPHQETGWLFAWWNGEWSAAFRWVPREVRVLDIGCGSGQTLVYHRTRGCQAFGVEADENVRELAARQGLDICVGLFDASLYLPGSFDVVTLDQVIEHTVDPLELLRGVARILKPGGTAILTTPNVTGVGARLFGRYWVHWHIPYHLQFFSPQSMRCAAEAAGLQTQKRRTVTSSEWLNYQWLHLLSYPSQGQRSAFWSPGARPCFLYCKARRLFVGLHRLFVNHLVTRVLDALGLGDNQVFILRKPVAA